MKKQIVIILLSALFLFGSGNGIFAQWIAPGMLTKAHKELRELTGCLKCHSLTGGLDNASCKSCHDEIRKKNKKESTGLHSRVKSECVTCHTDHRGADYNIVTIDEKSFKHSLTGYELKDRHVVTCDKCHKKEDTYLGNSPECLKCHPEIHNKKVPEDCIQCHTYKEWKDHIFDHKKAEFKLVGKHNDAKCELCHPRNTVAAVVRDKKKEFQVMKFKPTQSEKCRDCHHDVHKKQFEDQKCDICHSLEKGWKDFTFRHESDKYKGFKLVGKHKEAECQKCHKRSDIVYTEFDKENKLSLGMFKPTKAEVCRNCHYDIHGKQFEDQKCDICHSLEKGWKDYTFRHESDKYKGFKLVGKHEKVECEKCHKRSEISFTEFDKQKKVQVGEFKALKTETCSNCHYSVHEGQFKGQKCDACHSVEKEWKDKTFSHDSEEYDGYKLEGKHKKVECEKCHKRSEISYMEFDRKKTVQVGQFKPLKTETCGDCHKNGHEAKFKEIDNLEDVTCSECHSVEREFKDHIYKHKEDSRYLKYNRDGQVKEKDCAACHFCDPNLFTISSCFDQMGMTMPGK